MSPDTRAAIFSSIIRNWFLFGPIPVALILYLGIMAYVSDTLACEAFMVYIFAVCPLYPLVLIFCIPFKPAVYCSPSPTRYFSWGSYGDEPFLSVAIA